MESPQVSAVIPVYNGEAYLGAAIESVLGQSLPAAEIIVADDGSTDRSLDVARSYGDLVKVLAHDHAGICATLNRAVDKARGPLLAFLDADDLWTPRKLETQVAVLGSSAPPDMVFGLSQNFREDGTDEPAVPGICKGTQLMARDLWLDVGRLDETLVIGEFMDWFARALERGLAFLTIDEVLLRRRIHGSNSGIRLAAQRSQYALVAKRALDRRRQAAATLAEPPEET